MRDMSIWGASSHGDYREWASAALGDERQVYARSTSARARELVFMPDGAADEFREAAQCGRLGCPVPGCPSPQLTTRGPKTRRHHFVHRQVPPDPAHQRAYVRRVATELIVDWIRSAHPQSVVAPNLPVGSVTAAALVTGPTGLRFAVMFVDHRLGVDAWWDADVELDRLGMLRGWIFAPRQFLRYPQPSPDAGRDDPAALDRARGDVVLDRALFREMRAAGRWPLLLNINNREVANLVAPAGAVARRLRLHPAASGDRVMHLVSSPLSRCRLCLDGIATPAVGAGVLAAPRLARERRAAARAPNPDDRDVITTDSSRLTETRVRDAFDAAGAVTTFATLVSTLDIDSDAGEKDLRELLYYLRLEGVIEFDRPLGRFSAIRRPTP